MGRRKNSGLFEDLVALVALMPWWAGVGLALVSYLWLHGLAGAGPSPVTQPGKLDVVGAMSTSLAMIGQYLLPVVCLVGAATSAWKRRQRRALLRDAAAAQDASALDGMSWPEFEALVGEAFRLRGFSVLESGGGGPDGGVDLVLKKGSEKFLVQCKHWKAYKVGVEVVRELYGVMASRGAAGGFVVTSGRFTSDAMAFAAGTNLQLLDGQRLRRMIEEVQRSPTNAEPAAPPVRLIEVQTDPACPVCGSHMVKRTARKGATAGASFLGCSRYPACRGTRPLTGP